MSDSGTNLSGPDFHDGVDISTIPETDMLLGHVADEPALLVRRGNDLFAIGAICTHYGAPLIDGLLVDGGLRCPWHHACFNLHTGRALRAPALAPVSCWKVEQRAGKAYVTERVKSLHRPKLANPPSSVVIVGGGAAGNAAAEELRKEGYSGPITILSADSAPPCDRPNLSKGYLAGAMGEDSNILRPEQFYKDNEIELKLAARVRALDLHNERVEMADGNFHRFGALLLATGAEPVQLRAPGVTLPHVHYLRTVQDSHAIVEKSRASKHAVIIGSSFIGLEVAASLRARKLEVDVVGLETIPMERVLGEKVGRFLLKLHQANGVKFHLGTTADQIDESNVTLANGKTLPADLVVIGIGVRPAVELAEQAGLAIDRGILVDEYLEASAPRVFAAGDIARWPDPLSGERIRVEHFVVAERQGQTAARNILGHRERFDTVPFFWTEQYDFSLAYVGHAAHFDHVEIDGSLDERNCTITYRQDGKKLAAAFVHRDLEGLRTEVELERVIAKSRAPIGAAAKSGVSIP